MKLPRRLQNLPRCLPMSCYHRKVSRGWGDG